MARVPAGIKRAELIELLEIDEQIKQLTERKKPLADKARRAHADLPADVYVYGPVVLALVDAQKFDSSAFAAAYPEPRHPGFYESAVRADLVPKELRGQFTIPERRMSLRRQAASPKATP